MSITEIAVKIVGLVLAVFGLFAILNSVLALPATWIIVLAGLGCLAIGVYIVRGGSFEI